MKKKKKEVRLSQNCRTIAITKGVTYVQQEYQKKRGKNRKNI